MLPAEAESFLSGMIMPTNRRCDHRYENSPKLFGVINRGNGVQRSIGYSLLHYDSGKLKSNYCKVDIILVLFKFLQLHSKKVRLRTVFKQAMFNTNSSTNV